MLLRWTLKEEAYLTASLLETHFIVFSLPKFFYELVTSYDYHPTEESWIFKDATLVLLAEHNLVVRRTRMLEMTFL